jgi:multidrug efflux pump subunit AcrA (membrane-fusion protein)
MGILAILVLAIFASTWIHLGIRFARPCRLFPQREWVLIQTQPDAFEARFLDRSEGNRQQIDLYRFERGDLVRFRLNEAVAVGARISAGQEVARLDSYQNRQIVDQLRPQLEEAEANLRAASTGQREEVIALARSEIASASAARDLAAATYQRSVSMLEQGLFSEAAHESTQTVLHRAEADLDAARNRLRVAEVGEKAEVVEAWRARRDWLSQMLTDAGSRLEGDHIRCPIAGDIVTVQGDSALVRVAALDTLYAVAPVPPSRVETLAAGQSATIRPVGSSWDAMEGQVVQVDRQASTIRGLSFYWVTIAVPNSGRLPVVGVRGTVHFRGAKVSLLAWLSDQLRHAADRSLGA